jgi:hypothetical protein
MQRWSRAVTSSSAEGVGRIPRPAVQAATIQVAQRSEATWMLYSTGVPFVCGALSAEVVDV